MRRILSTLGTAIFISIICRSCYKYDDSHTHLSKTEAFGDKYKSIRQNGKDSIRTGIPPDTVVLVSGVGFDEGYDWRKDSLYGSASGRIFLLRNGEVVMDIEAGGNSHASTAPDKHHLVGEHLFTEFCDVSGTYIGKDGQELFSYPGRESLRGLVIEGDDVYTLGQGLDGQGLALRRNGETIFASKNGNIAGQMLDDPDYPSGALYMDSGHMYFCYWRPETSGSSRKAWFIVEDCTETQFSTGYEGLLDIRVKEGQVISEPLTAKQSIFTRFTEKCLVIAYQDGTLMIAAPYMKHAEITKESFYYFSFRNSSMCGNSLYIALTPFDKGKAPFIWKNGAMYKMDINGFLTGISVSVLPREGS